MMSGHDNHTCEKRKAASTPASDDARKLFAYLLLAGRNLSLYPEGHSISLNSIRQLHGKLEAYILRHGDFRIEIGKDRVTCQDEMVYAGPSDEGSLAFILFRDGIRWLEFTGGISLEDLQEFLFIIHRHQSQSPEPAGDVVTAFWEARFASIQYEAVDIFPTLEPETDDIVSGFQLGSARQEVGKESAPEDAGMPDGDPAIDPAALLLSPKEQALLQEMIFREETAPASAHLNMLLDSLLQYQDEESFRVILDVLAEEFTAFLASRDFQACLTILEGLRYIADSGKLKDPRVLSLLEAFFEAVSGSDHLQPLEEIWTQITAQQAGILEHIFLRLRPSAVEPLMRLLMVHHQPDLQFIVEDAVRSLVVQDAHCLESLIRHSDERMVARLVPVLLKLDRSVSLEYLMRLAGHSSPPVRRLAVKGILQGRDVTASDIFKLIDDPDEAVRRMILRQLGHSRDEAAEALLVNYLQSSGDRPPQPEHILECFKALGKCGSMRSVSFLRETLLRRKWMAGLRKSAYRQGAALALAALKIPESRQVLEDAGRSLHPGLRKLVRDAGASPSAHQGGK
jgi:HEAT repeat protein